MEAHYSVVMFSLHLWFIFHVLSIVAFSNGFQFFFFIIISHLWIWWVLTRRFNYRIVIGKVSSTGFPDGEDSPQFTWNFLMTELYTFCILFLFSSASRISSYRDRHDSESLPKRHVQISSLWKQQIFSLIALVSLGTASEAKEELNTKFHTILLFLVWILGISLEVYYLLLDRCEQTNGLRSWNHSFFSFFS